MPGRVRVEYWAGAQMTLGKFHLDFEQPAILMNGNRQIGLGNNVTLDTITVPTEIVLWKGAPTSSRTKCFDIVAGNAYIF